MRTLPGFIDKVRCGLFLDVALLCGVLQFSLEAPYLGRLPLLFEPLTFGQAVALEPFVKAVLQDADAIGDIGHRLPQINDLPDRFDLELFRVRLAAHDFSFCLLFRLRSAYWFWGDSVSGKNYLIFQFFSSIPAMPIFPNPGLEGIRIGKKYL